MPAYKKARLLVLPLILLGFALVAGQLRVSAQSSSQYEEGARLYAENCAVCHGPNGEGRVGATLNKNWPAIRPEATVKTIIENGVEGAVMPAWSQKNGGPLTDAEIESPPGVYPELANGRSAKSYTQTDHNSTSPDHAYPKCQG